MKFKQLKYELLNGKDSARKVLRDNFPFIERLENLDSIKDLKLTDLNLNYEFIGAEYEAVASPEIYPHVKKNLVEAGITNKNNFITYKISKGCSDEYVGVRISFSKIQAHLKIYNPNYKPEN